LELLAFNTHLIDRFQFSRNFVWFCSRFGWEQLLNECQQQNCSPLIVLFSDVDIAQRSPARGLQSQYSGRKWQLSSYTRENISQTISVRPRLLLTINRKSHIGCWMSTWSIVHRWAWGSWHSTFVFLWISKHICTIMRV